jgi:hypothetical protein
MQSKKKGFIMKKIFLLILLMLFANMANAQWEDDVRLTHDSSYSATSLNNAKCIAASGDTVHIVWTDERDGNSEIYYKRSVDAGITWSDDIRFTNNDANSKQPSIAVSGNDIYVVWADDREGDYEIYFEYSSDGGNNWENEKRLTFEVGNSYSPSIAVCGNNLHIVWRDVRDGNNEIYYKHSTDNGVNWEKDVRMTETLYKEFFPSIAVSGSNVHIVWFDLYQGNAVPYKRSTDSGNTWEDSFQLNQSDWGSYPNIAAFNSEVYIVWKSRLRNIYFKQSDNDGNSWRPEVLISSGTSKYPSVATSGSGIGIVWQDNRNGNYDIAYHFRGKAANSGSIDTMLTNNDFTSSEMPSIAVSGSAVHMIWTDKRDGPNGEIYYKRNPTGNIVSVNEEIITNNDKVLLYPNPANDFLYISCSENCIGTIQIFSVLGTKVLESEFKNRIDVSILPEDMYYLLINSGNNIEKTKFVIMR